MVGVRVGRFIIDETGALGRLPELVVRKKPNKERFEYKSILISQNGSRDLLIYCILTVT